MLEIVCTSSSFARFVGLVGVGRNSIGETLSYGSMFVTWCMSHCCMAIFYGNPKKFIIVESWSHHIVLFGKNRPYQPYYLWLLTHIGLLRTVML